MKWEEVELGEVLSYEQPNKYIVEDTNYHKSIGTPVLTAGKTFLLGYTDENTGIFDKGPCIIFDDFTTAFHFVGFPFKVKSSAMKILQADESRADLKFLYYRMLKTGVDTTLHKRYWISKYSKLKIPLPPLPVQQKIAAILDAADDYRSKTKALLDKYDQLTQSIFLEMFGDPVRNEKGWDVKKLQTLSSKIASGNTPKGGKQVYVEKGITFFRSQNVWRNRIEYEDIAYLDNKTHLKMSKTSLLNGDILMTKTGRFNTPNSSLGRAAMYTGPDNMANVNGHVYVIRPNKIANSNFILFILTTIQYRDYIRRVCVGGIDKRQINKNHIEDFPIIQPPESLQSKFVETNSEITKIKISLLECLEKSESLFQSLLQKAFKGELVS